MVRVKSQGVRHIKEVQDPVDNCFSSPKRKDLKMSKGFQGKLSHTSPTKMLPPRSISTRNFVKFQQHCLDGEQSLSLETIITVHTHVKSIKTEALDGDANESNLIKIEIPETDQESPRTSPHLCKEDAEVESPLKVNPLELNTKTEKDELPLLEVPNYETEVLITETAVIKTPSKDPSVISPLPHKIQFCKEKHEPLIETINSPSSALSYLRISQSPKKTTKARQRLYPSQSSNQQAEPKKGKAKAPRISKKDLALTNHKVTEYFPIRRSIRKTKRTVLEEKQMLLEESVKAECEDGLEVRNFEGKGRGVVATRQFFKGDFVIEYSGELIDMGEAKSREQLYTQDQNTGCYMYYFKYKSNQYCIDATKESGRLGRLVNHSRNGNLTTKTVPIGSKPHLVLIAKEHIEEGEEILYDYGDRSKESLLNHPWLNL